MKRERNPQLKRRKILDATLKILSDGGYFANFSLDKVAKLAGVSKGGLMHHFASRDALLTAAAHDAIETFANRFRALVSAETPSKSKRTHAYINTIADNQSPLHQASPILLSYLNAQPNTNEPTRFEAWHEQLVQDDLDPVTAALVRFAVDGILYTELIDNQPIPSELRQQVIKRLHTLVAESASSYQSTDF